MAKEDGDEEFLSSVNQDMNLFKSKLFKYFLKSLMSNEMDNFGCFIEIRAGSGGTESCDFVAM